MKRTLLVLVLILLPTIALETVITQTYSVSYTCSGSAGPYPFTFPISDPTAMNVTENGTLLSPTAYSIVPLNNLYDNGGSVTLNTACSTGTLLLERNTPVTQTSVYTDNRPLPMKSFENSLDKLTEIIIERGKGGILNLTTIGSTGPSTINGTVLNIPVYSNTTSSNPSGPLYSVQTDYPSGQFGNGLGDFLDQYPISGPLTFTGAGIDAVVVDDGTYSTGGTFNFSTTENNTTAYVPCPACFIVNTAMNGNGVGGYLWLNAYGSPVGDGVQSGTVYIAGNSPNASSENDSGLGPGYVLIQSNSNAGSDSLTQGSLVLDAEPYDSVANNYSSANMLLKTCNINYSSAAESCNFSVSTNSDGASGSGQMIFKTNDLSGNPPVDATEDAISFIADGGYAPFNITSAYTSISSGLRSNSSSNTDLTGRLTLSGGSATQPLTGTYASPPNCHADDVTNTAAGVITVETASPDASLTFTGNDTDVIKYFCDGMN